uniref:Uncharacterized protein n=1 Tax=Arundo donax TaxID=35708 RepID=A0A0A9BTB7_ARUDO
MTPSIYVLSQAHGSHIVIWRAAWTRRQYPKTSERQKQLVR